MDYSRQENKLWKIFLNLNNMERKIKLRNCKICQKELKNQYSISNVCSEKCYNIKQEQKKQTKEQYKNIAKTLIDNRQKNTTREVTEIVKKRVYEREYWKCVICHTMENLESVPHHANYGIFAKFTADRNSSKELVTICRNCHYYIHSKWDNEKREFCINYLKEICH